MCVFSCQVEVPSPPLSDDWTASSRRRSCRRKLRSVITMQYRRKETNVENSQWMSSAVLWVMRKNNTVTISKSEPNSTHSTVQYHLHVEEVLPQFIEFAQIAAEETVVGI